MPIDHAPLDADGEAILWPRPGRGERLGLTWEGVETVLCRSLDVLGLTSYSALAEAMGFNRSMIRKWRGENARPPSRAAVIRLLYLFCLHKKDAQVWRGTDLSLIDWNNVHLYGIPYTPYSTTATATHVDDGVVTTAKIPLFRSKHPNRKATGWPQWETVLTWSIRGLRLKSLVGLAKAVNLSVETVNAWVKPPKRGPSPVALWKMAYLWLLHFDDPQKWSGAALRSVDWRSIHKYGIAYQPYAPFDSGEDTEDVREFLRQREAARQVGARFTPIVKTQPADGQLGFGG